MKNGRRKRGLMMHMEVVGKKDQRQENINEVSLKGKKDLGLLFKSYASSLFVLWGEGEGEERYLFTELLLYGGAQSRLLHVTGERRFKNNLLPLIDNLLTVINYFQFGSFNALLDG